MIELNTIFGLLPVSLDFWIYGKITLALLLIVIGVTSIHMDHT